MYICLLFSSFICEYILGIVLGARMLHCFVGNVRNLIKSGFLLCVHIKLNNTKCRERASESNWTHVHCTQLSFHLWHTRLNSPYKISFIRHGLHYHHTNAIFWDFSTITSHTHTHTRALNSTLSYAWCISVHSALMHSKLNSKSISFRNVYYTLDLSAFFCIEI